MSTSTLSDTGLGRTDLGGLRIAIANWRDPWHPQAGGAESYAWELARALAGAKNLVWVGRLVAHKRAGLLVGVAERLRQRPPQERPFLDVLAERPVLDQFVAAGAAARRQATPMERLTGASQP